MNHPSKIVSGGQTGLDRAALDAGIAAGLPVGGYVLNTITMPCYTPIMLVTMPIIVKPVV